MLQTQRKINELETLVENAFKDFCKQPYHLHAILVHDGSAESGHYYSFVFDREKKQWFKFNDHLVSPVDEEQVMKESEGGQLNSHKVAYMLIYINEFIVQSVQPQT